MRQLVPIALFNFPPNKYAYRSLNSIALNECFVFLNNFLTFKKGYFEKVLLKKNLLVRSNLILIVFAFFSLGSTASAQFAGGDGSRQNPYKIQTWEHLRSIELHPNASYMLISDLETLTQGYEEFAGPNSNGGQGWAPLKNFKGKFYGNGFLIKDLNINRPLQSSLGLFGNSAMAEFYEIQLKNVTVSGASDVGSLIGVAINVKIIECSFSGTVSGKTYVGGLVGTMGNSVIVESFSLGNVTGKRSVGGIAGNVYQTDVFRSFSSGKVTAELEAGGLVGYFQSHSKNKIENCYSIGKIESKEIAGGLVGKMTGGSVNDSYFAGLLPSIPGSDGFFGQSAQEVVANRSFWDISLGHSDKGFSGENFKATLELKSSGFIKSSTWDFENTWAIMEPSEDQPYISYPYLKAISYDQIGRAPATNPIPGLENFKVPSQVEFPKERSADYGDPEIQLGEEFDPYGFPINYSTPDTSVLKISGNYGSILKAGTAKISIKIEDGKTAAKDQLLTVHPAILKVRASQNQSKIYGEEDPELLIEADGLKYQDGIEVIEGYPQREAGEQSGSYPILQGSLSAGSNYLIEFIASEFSILKRELRLTVQSQKKSFGSLDPVLTFEVSGMKASEEIEAVLEGQLERVEGENVGMYAIEQGSLQIGSNYQLIFQGDSLEILPALIISMEDFVAINTPWSVNPKLPESAKFLTQEGHWAELPLEWNNQPANYLKRGAYTLLGRIQQGNFSLPDGIYPEVKVVVLPKPAPIDLIFHRNPSQSEALGHVEVVDPVDDIHLIRLSEQAEDNAFFQLDAKELKWSANSPSKSKTKYLIEFEVEDRDGNIFKKKLTLENRQWTEKTSDLEIFNSFSPNGDGFNDTWHISNDLKGKEFNLTVMDNAGQVVFQSQCLDSRWDGTFKGRQVPEGSYYWVLEAEGQIQRGPLNLLRGN